jgi:two-component system, NarL family, invasion response regulator UvrY
MASVLIADDHALIRSALRELLEGDSFITALGEASTGADAIKELTAERWDLVILDINLPGGLSGIDVLREIRARFPATKVLILSGLPEKQYAVNVLRAGASGYINKDAPSEELLTAIRSVLQGRKYMSAATAERLLTDVGNDEGLPIHARLSERENQVFAYIASGKGITAIAEELNISVKTASTYRTRILEKLGMTSNAEITAYAMRNNLI